jgi:hypothetical protein
MTSVKCFKMGIARLGLPPSRCVNYFLTTTNATPSNGRKNDHFSDGGQMQ